MDKEMIEKKPIKRRQALQPLSRDHHHTLLLAWKIRKGLNAGIEPQRIKNYADWFYKTYAAAHFQLEEKYIYPVLNASDDRIIKALKEHAQLRELFADTSNLSLSLSSLANLLEAHIRFEERTLFNIIQEKATDEQLKIIDENIPSIKFEENESDCFWV